MQTQSQLLLSQALIAVDEVTCRLLNHTAKMQLLFKRNTVSHKGNAHLAKVHACAKGDLLQSCKQAPYAICFCEAAGALIKAALRRCEAPQSLADSD